MKRNITVCMLLSVMLLFSGSCFQPDADVRQSASLPQQTNAEMKETRTSMTLSVNGTPLCVDWEENETAAALAALAMTEPVSVTTRRYGDFEQVGQLPSSLPEENADMTAQPGDIMLYAGDQIVLFYGTNTWSYTRIGCIQDLSVQQMETLLSVETVDIVIACVAEE